MFREFGIDEFLLLLKGAQWTIALSFIAFIGGSVLGLVVAAVRAVGHPILNYIAIVYIQFIQGTPLLGQMFLFFFGFSIFGLDVSPWFAVSISLILFSGAFLGDIWRGCIQAVPQPQWEASACLGLGFIQQMRYIILPQAIRIAIPPTVGFLVQIIKNTSLAAIVGFVELLRAGQMVNAATFKPFTVYIAVALIYFALCYPLSLWSRQLERKLNVAHSH